MTLLMLVLSIEGFSQDYKKIVDSTNKWNYLDWLFTTNGEGEAKTNSLFITNDTIIEDISYKKLMCKIIREIDTSVVYAAGIREDTIHQIVYIRPEYQPEELLYSFNHSVGDTISIDTASWNDYYTMRSVKSIGTYDFNGFTGKKIQICDSIFSINNPTWPPSELTCDFWYEGIGSLVSIFNLQEIGILPIGEIELLCYWNKNNFIYQSPDWTVCEYALITSIEEHKIPSNLDISPNPTTGRLRITTEAEIKEICLIDVFGRSVFYASGLDIDLSNLPKGMYILQITTLSNEIIIRKVIKNDL